MGIDVKKTDTTSSCLHCTWELGPVYLGVGTCVLGSWDLCDRNLHKKMKEMFYCNHNNTYFGNLIEHDYIWPFLPM